MATNNELLERVHYRTYKLCTKHLSYVTNYKNGYEANLVRDRFNNVLMETSLNTGMGR